MILSRWRTIEYLAKARREQQVPAALAAMDARAPEGLLPLICHIGHSHAGCDAWKNGSDYQLPQLGVLSGL